MRQIALVVCVLAVLVVPVVAAEPLPDFVFTEPAYVTNVVDGDTFDVYWPDHSEYTYTKENPLRIRPASIGAPDPLKHECFADEATAYATALLFHKWVWLDCGDFSEPWTFGRFVAKVWLDCTRTASFGQVMISQGYARILTDHPRGKQLAAFGIEEEAKQAGRGLWGCPDE